MDELRRFRIERIVLHQIYQRQADRELIEPFCSSEMIELEAEGLSLLQDRIINAIGDNSHSIEMAINKVNVGDTFQHCAKLLDTIDSAFCEASSHIAKKLAESQTSRGIPGGVLVIFTGKTGADNWRFVGVLKAEMHGGFLKEDSSTGIAMRYINDLLLTPSQRLFKIGLFREKVGNDQVGQPRSANEFVARVYDRNMSHQDTQLAAKYFYDSFLGCGWQADDKKLTFDFYIHSRDFINQALINDRAKYDLNLGLQAYVGTSQSAVIETSAYSANFLPPELRPAYANFMESRNFPLIAIPKDICPNSLHQGYCRSENSSSWDDRRRSQ